MEYAITTIWNTYAFVDENEFNKIIKILKKLNTKYEIEIDKKYNITILK